MEKRAKITDVKIVLLLLLLFSCSDESGPKNTSITIFDEAYNNKIFFPNQAFGSEVNETTPVFSNNHPGALAHAEDFVRVFNKNGSKLYCHQCICTDN